LHGRITEAARRTVCDRFCSGIVVPRYEDVYERLARRAGAAVAP
jgi:hypothetical protein